jgi:hypothetical protein
MDSLLLSISSASYWKCFFLKKTLFSFSVTRVSVLLNTTINMTHVQTCKNISRSMSDLQMESVHFIVQRNRQKRV